MKPARTLLVTAALSGAAFALLPVTPALAPTIPPAERPQIPYTQYATLAAVEAQTILGYQPCYPTFGDVPDDLRDEGVVADATIGPPACQVRWMRPTADHPLPSAHVKYVAWHEVCHLSTIASIYESPIRDRFADPYHDHPDFARCIAQGPARPQDL